MLLAGLLLAGQASGPVRAGRPKLLIVNADDFGLTRGVNEGILRGHREGLITATTILADAAAFEHAAALARQTPSLDVGVHLVLWPDGMRFLPFFGRALTWSRSKVEKEFTRQVQKVVDAGLRPSHLDTHKHTHLFPQVMSAMVRVARRYDIHWLRRPVRAGAVRRYGLCTADHFVTTRPTAQSVPRVIRGLRPGITEWMTHSGNYDPELDKIPTRLRRQRQVELEALCAPEARSQLTQRGVKLVTFRELTPCGSVIC
jgi:predicted glycoside hydrolase/deacetylase ChbG (UPF0249 family)